MKALLIIILFFTTIDITNNPFREAKFSSTPPRCLTFINGEYIEHECEVYDESR